MIRREIPCIIQPIKILKLDDDSLSGCGIIEVQFTSPNSVKIDTISFTNYYVASLAIKGVYSANKTHGSRSKLIVDDMILMEHPHFSNESQTNINIDSKQLMICDDDEFIGCKFILRQPSPNWKKFNLENIVFYEMAVASEANTSINEKVVSKDNKEETSLKELSSDLKKLNQIKKILDNRIPSTDPLRFDTMFYYTIKWYSSNQILDEMAQPPSI